MFFFSPFFFSSFIDFAALVGSNATFLLKMTLRTTNDINDHLRRTLALDTEEPSVKRPRHVESEEYHSNESGDENEFEFNIDQQSISGGGEDNNGENDNNTDSADDGFEDDTQDIASPHPVFLQGTDIYDDGSYIAHIKAVSQRRRTRYSLSDHLFSVRIRPKRHTPMPFLIDLDETIGTAIIRIIDRLKVAYRPLSQNQIYITVIEKHILNGLNTGNYTLNAPSAMIAEWVLGIIYNYLKSRQTLKLNKSFKIQIKVHSSRHTRDMEKNKRTFVKNVYH